MPDLTLPDGRVRLLVGHVLDRLAELPDESINCVVTSPPYWSLRKYKAPNVVWGGDPRCLHEWGLQIPGDARGGSGPGAKEGYTGKTRWQHGAWDQYIKGRLGQRSTLQGGLATQLEAKGQQVESAYGRNAQRGNFCRLCGAWRGQYGLEPTPDCLAWASGKKPCNVCYVCHTLMWLREVRRVLRKDGTMWLNMGDGYAGSGQGPADKKWSPKQATNIGSIDLSGTPACSGLKPKDAVLMPFRIALVAQADGWWVRSVIIWAKQNTMPESVKDRPTDAHEYIFLLTKSARYWYDAEAVKEPLTSGPSDIKKMIKEKRRIGGKTLEADDPLYKAHKGTNIGQKRAVGSPNGRNLRSFWSFGSHPYFAAHFAVFPPKLPRRCILLGCPEGGMVLDPFCGSGTTLEVAYHLGRRAIGIELSEEYAQMCVARLRQMVLPEGDDDSLAERDEGNLVMGEEKDQGDSDLGSGKWLERE